jgi:aldose 1-epimerase
MPAGIGIHPYFPKPAGTMLRFDATGVWPPDAPEAVELGCGPLEAGLDFRPGQDVSSIVLDRCFEGWDGIAELSYPGGQRTRIAAEGALTRLQIYDAWDYPYICIEPVSNANDGFNRMAKGVEGHGIHVLEPGRTLRGRMIITPL